jgi:hypothetical protein
MSTFVLLSLPLVRWEGANSCVPSDLSEAFPGGELSNRFREDWLTHMVKEVRTNRDYADRTTQTARWAREQIKRQTGRLSPGFVAMSRPPSLYPQQLRHHNTLFSKDVNGHAPTGIHAPQAVHPWHAAVIEHGGSSHKVSLNWAGHGDDEDSM